MNFTREPIIETIITPKEGYKLVLRNSKASGQEEFFVDAIEVITLGNACFYRSLEKPKCFIVPISDYEILEVRETRVVLKTPGVEKGGIKIGGGRETPLKPPREPKEEVSQEPSEQTLGEVEAAVAEQRGGEKKRERRRFRKKRGRGEGGEQEEEGAEGETPEPSEEAAVSIKSVEEAPSKPREERATLIPPPPTLISETLARYKETPSFSGAFFEKKEEGPQEAPKKDEEEELETKRLLLEEVEEMDFITTREKADEDLSEENEDNFS